MRISLVGADSQNCIQKHHALIRPFFQISVVRHIAAQIVVKLLVNIYQGRGRIHARLDRKAEAMGLAVAVVRILP